jgi:NADH:ubiquinone reductase (H+-translocating)
VEIAGALAELNKFILPKDYPELRDKRATIHLIEGTSRLLNTMSAVSSDKAKQFLEKHEVQVRTNTFITDCDEKSVSTSMGEKIIAGLIIWTAGISGNVIKGISQDRYGKNGRMLVDGFSRV